MSLADVASLYGLDEDSPLNHTQTESLSSAILYSLVSCDQPDSEESGDEVVQEAPSSYEGTVVGVAFVDGGGGVDGWL